MKKRIDITNVSLHKATTTTQPSKQENKEHGAVHQFITKKGNTFTISN